MFGRRNSMDEPSTKTKEALAFVFGIVIITLITGIIYLVRIKWFDA